MLCFSQFFGLSTSCIERRNIFCSRIITKPIPNSTADKTKKKKVKESKFVLSYSKPIDSTIT